METTTTNVILEAIRQVREQISRTRRWQSEEISRLEQSLELLRNQQRETEEVFRHLLEPIEKTLAEEGNARAPSVQSVRGSVGNLAKTTYAEQVFDALAAETARMNLRSVVFSVRGKMAWGASAGGFELSNEDLHSLAVPLNRENPFRLVFETAEALPTRPEGLRGNPNVLEKLHPAPDARLWLFPVRSAEAVTAILYAERGAIENSIVTDALGLLVEFAGLQLDRLAVRSAGTAVAETLAREEDARRLEVARASSPEAETAPPGERPGIAAAEPAGEPEAGEAAAAAAAALPAPDPATLSEENQKVHRDAQRFAKLLVSEIELYNKEQVRQGRTNKDLYQRLRKDIDRSRQTYEKRFGNTAVNQVDYFHAELVRALAENDPSLLGSDYPGPSA